MTRTRRMLVLSLLAIAIAAAVAAAPAKKAKPKPRPPALPSWAPKHPSKEFLRAAKVLKPIPPEVQAYDPLYPAAWELFGALTDRQLATFLKWTQQSMPLSKATDRIKEYHKSRDGAQETGGKLVWKMHQVYFPFQSLRGRQRQVFDGIVKAWPIPGKNDREDLLVQFYRAGAKKNFSNVKLGFDTTGHLVYFSWQVEVTMGHANSGYIDSEPIAYL